MIVNTEVRDLTQDGKPVLNQWGECKRFLCVSYVNSDGQIKYFTWIIPDEMMYQWKYATKKDTPDPVYQSWDFKGVVKEPIKGNFSEQRIHEMLLYLKENYPDHEAIKEMDELNIPDISYLDIEVNVGEDGFPEAADAKNQVNTISFCHGDTVWVLGLAPLSDTDIKWIQNEITKHCKDFDDDYKFEYRYHPNEISLLNDIFYNFIAPAACVSGWNYFGYDYPYLYNRSKLLNIDIKCLSPTQSFTNYKPQNPAKGCDVLKIPVHKCMFDYMEIYKKWDRSISPKVLNTLDWVSNRVLGVKKVVHELGFKEMWEQKPKEYVFYNAIDSVLIREIDKKLRTSSAFFGLANIMHTPALTAFSSTRSIEIVQAEYLYKDHRVFPVVKKDKTESEGYEGAFVFEPIPGIYNNVLTLDYASLYPTTMRQFNISPDTFKFKNKNHVRQDNEIMCTNGAVYTKDFEGFIPKILTDFYNKRKAYKKEMKIAEKEKNHLIEILNSRKAKSAAV